MKKTKVIIFLVLISLIFTVNIFTASSYDRSILPHNIKIGLYFDKTAKQILQLESNTTFEVGIFNEKDEFISFFNLNENKIILRKDGLYADENLNGNVVDIKELNNIQYIEDYYHVQIGQDFANYDQAYSFLKSISIENTQVYISYEDGWKVYAGLYTKESDANEEAIAIKANYNYETNVINPSATRVQLTDEKDNIIFIYNSSDEVYFAGKQNDGDIPLIKVEGVSYRGAITAKRLSNSDMTIINKLPLEEYLYGVIPSEMPASWPIEALKAQAIAARGFAVTNLNKYSRFDFNLCTTTYSQVYKGYGGEHPNTNKAVDETKHMIITHNGKPVAPYYHADSGGHTEDSENVWTNPLPYIRGVKDDFSLDTPYSPWTVTFTNEEIKGRLANNNIFIGDILNMEVTSISNNGRVLSLVLYGTEGQEVLEKEKSRTVFGLRSNLFTINSNDDKNDSMNMVVISGKESEAQSIDLKGKYIATSSGVHQITDTKGLVVYNGKQYKDIGKENTGDAKPVDVFIFDGRGYGHGLGMSQYGAKKMAELGYKYDEILTYYYTGVKVE